MAIFASNRDSYLTFYIVLPDAARVKALQAQYPQGVNRAPWNPGPPPGGAAVEFGAPFFGYTQAPVAPYIWTPYSGYATQGTPYPLNVATFTRHTGGFLGIGGTNTRYFWVGKFVLAADTTGDGGDQPVDAPVLEKAPIAKRRWIEGFDAPSHGPFTASTISSLPSRDAAHAVGGCGLGFRGPVLSDSTPIAINAYTPGLTASSSWERFYVRLRRKPDVTTSFWRCKGTPSAGCGISLEVTPTGDIVAFDVDSTGTKTLLGAVGTLTVWSGLPGDDVTRRVDCLIGYNPLAYDALNPSSGHIRIYLDGILRATFDSPQVLGAGGLGANSHGHGSSVVGNNFGGANQLEIDIDHWVGMDAPAGRIWGGRGYINEWSAAAGYHVGDVVYVSDEDHVYKCIVATAAGANKPSLRSNGHFWHRYEGLDWLNGSRVQPVKPRAFSGNHAGAAWAGDYRTLIQNAFNLTGSALASTTSGSLCAVLADAEDHVDNDKGSIGCAGVMVCAYASRGTSDGLLGASLNAGAPVMQAEVGANGTLVAQKALVHTDGIVVDLLDVSPLELRYQKGADVAAGAIRQLSAMVEMVGVWGKTDWRPAPVAGVYLAGTTYAVNENVIFNGAYYTCTAVGTGAQPSPPDPGFWVLATPPVFPYYVGQHNAPYKNSPWSLGAAGAPPAASFIVVGGTYVGNNLGQDLTFRTPVHLLIVRPVTGGTGGAVWSSTMLAAMKNWGQGTVPIVPSGKEDLTFAPGLGEDIQQQRYLMRIAGSDTQVNATGVTYQYFAVCDPGSRFLLNTSFAHQTNSGASIDNPLIDSSFAADGLLAFLQTLDATTAKTVYMQTPGNTPGTLASVTGAALASALTTAAGIVTSKTALHALALTQTAVSLFRKHDGNNDPNEASAISIGSYVGDGSGARTISPAVTGKRPLWAIVIGESGTGYTRDPSNTGTNSSPTNGGVDAATGITGGAIDSFTVASGLNTNGVIYSYLLFWAGPTACNGGWGCNGEYIPVEAGPPVSPMWPPDPSPDPPPNGGGPPPPPVDEPDLSTACVSFSQRVCNRALSRIGISQQIVDLLNEQTEAATIARLHLKGEVEFSLHRWPWPFATSYADLVLVGGTTTVPVNPDWQYSYRAPADLVFARRIVNPTGVKRAYDPVPPTFRVGRDDVGVLIFTNQAISATAPVTLEYTNRAPCPASEGDAEFLDYLIWRMAAVFAGPLARDTKKQSLCLYQAEQLFQQAGVADANERQQEPPGEADWITGRNQ